jgi:hypothetical protein
MPITPEELKDRLKEMVLAHYGVNRTPLLPGHNDGGDGRPRNQSSGVLKIGYRTGRYVPLLVYIDIEPIQQHQGDPTAPSSWGKLMLVTTRL